MLVADLADDGSGIDTSTFGVRYAPLAALQGANDFTFSNGRVQGSLMAESLVIGQNTVTFSVQDLAGNLVERPLTLHDHRRHRARPRAWPDGAPAAGIQVPSTTPTPVTTDADGRT